MQFKGRDFRGWESTNLSAVSRNFRPYDALHTDSHNRRLKVREVFVPYISHSKRQ